jgi:hypothetical protein
VTERKDWLQRQYFAKAMRFGIPKSRPRGPLFIFVSCLSCYPFFIFTFENESISFLEVSIEALKTLTIQCESFKAFFVTGSLTSSSDEKVL